MPTYLFTVSFPVEADDPQAAQDIGWNTLLDPDPPEGLKEFVTLDSDNAEVPSVVVTGNLLSQAA